eukprot:CAMPEP_0185809850 /NCGR_PEP_ID=MMETSP1322-20130828/6440_1 /TAXON_ID=265543 /ORGANISM="Minutocellus polymorphus, Strain RCC2270" /LENGTH=70 /DNA_ID=CAMNT_0028506143 /DNA_START=330 /DNA_END=538 /DNA_ORIENTATION=-
MSGQDDVGSNLLGQSVVPDLMRVYESLTQSSTPHTATAAGGSAAASASPTAAATSPSDVGSQEDDPSTMP